MKFSLKMLRKAVAFHRLDTGASPDVVRMHPEMHAEFCAEVPATAGRPRYVKDESVPEGHIEVCFREPVSED